MDNLSQSLALINNPIVWMTIAVAIICYGLLFRFCFCKVQDQRWFELTRDWLPGIKQMLTTLPLLGLLGTITGLKDTFIRLADGGGLVLQELITGGIGDALFTTELGLVLVVPGILLVSYLNRQRQLWLL
ncbi:MAG TPA: MotA/TolQ/ExbB proton channel family protein, partial [Cellvibrionaceae bacterium]|nr:MotA/TolQ/ExbB proton channel family protein [Cellvibrionaceae bacterium]